MKSIKPLFRAHIFAASPPPLGGIASIVSMLKSSLGSCSVLGFTSPFVKGNQRFVLIRALFNLALLHQVIFRTRKDGRILFFSSSGLSFFEKLVWANFVRLHGRHPVLVMVDGHFPEFWYKLPLLVKSFITFLFDRASASLGLQSQMWLSYYECIFPSADFFVVGATVNIDFFQSPPWQDLNPIPTITYVGWITHSKGILDLIQAFAEIAPIFPDLRLRLIGPLFDDFHYWKNLSSSLGVLQKIDFVGPVADRQKIIAMLLDSTLFVLPSHAEGLPVALLEAMSLGLPCIASDVGSASDLLGDNHAGLLVPPRHPSRLARSLSDLLTNPIHRHSLSLNAISRVSSQYNEQQFASSYKNLLRI